MIVEKLGIEDVMGIMFESEGELSGRNEKSIIPLNGNL
jgi:hypothetical protein